MRIFGGAKYRYYIISPVRGGVPLEVKEFANRMDRAGRKVYRPWADAPQGDKTGINILKSHHDAMLRSSKVAVYWDIKSMGSHFDLGMAFAMSKDIFVFGAAQKDKRGKSFLKVIREWWGT